jgi:DNA-directed RNA polymerase subunit omega
MARVTVEDCLGHVQSRFSLVHLSVRRVLQLRQGVPPFVDAPKNKEVVLSLREIAAGKLTLENIRQLEEQEFLPETTSKKRQEVSQEEVMEIVEAETRFSVPPPLHEEDFQMSDEEE